MCFFVFFPTAPFDSLRPDAVEGGLYKPPIGFFIAVIKGHYQLLSRQDNSIFLFMGETPLWRLSPVPRHPMYQQIQHIDRLYTGEINLSP